VTAAEVAAGCAFPKEVVKLVDAGLVVPEKAEKERIHSFFLLFLCKIIKKRDS
jgi:hypothetical protein